MHRNGNILCIIHVLCFYANYTTNDFWLTARLREFFAGDSSKILPKLDIRRWENVENTIACFRKTVKNSDVRTRYTVIAKSFNDSSKSRLCRLAFFMMLIKKIK